MSSVTIRVGSMDFGKKANSSQVIGSSKMLEAITEVLMAANQ